MMVSGYGTSLTAMVLFYLTMDAIFRDVSEMETLSVKMAF